MDESSTPLELSLYPRLLSGLSNLEPTQYQAKIRNLCVTDLYFLLRYGLNRADAEKQWVFDRCREVQASPDGHIDLWAREHYKSTIITFAKTIQDILADPELTVGIFSHTRPIAKAFLRQIKRELEANDRLKEWFPDILWADPHKESPKWSEDEGIIVKRAGNPKESTVEASGLVDGQPTSKHYRLMVYDDVVTRESVTTPEQIGKTTEAWELSRNLSAGSGASRYVGTRYNFSDTYRTIIDRGTARPRVYAATTNGEADGEPVLMPRELLAQKRRDMGIYTFGCQMLQNPKADSKQGFRDEWLRHYRQANPIGMNVYMLVDAASAKKKSSDYTCVWVWGLAADQNFYCLDILRDRLNLTERIAAVMKMHRKWRPIRVGYEKYGLMADVEYLRVRQESENYRFEVVELGGPMPKADRIRRMVPAMEQARIYLPYTLNRTDHEGSTKDLVHSFVEEELKPFPVGTHDDMLDAASRIFDEEMIAMFPEVSENEDEYMGNRDEGRSAVGGY